MGSSHAPLVLGFKGMHTRKTSRSPIGTSVALLLMVALLFGFKEMPPRAGTQDLSTPEMAFQSLVVALKTNDTEALKGVATPTGISSLQELSHHDDYKQGLNDLGEDLEDAATTWDPITEEIYVAKASIDGRVHKMEFTREEPGWMLYHWQLGGGVK